MYLREFVSNHPDALNFIYALDKLEGEIHKILGVEWNCRKDTVEFEIKNRLTNQIVLKQSVPKISLFQHSILLFDSNLLNPCSTTVSENTYLSVANKSVFFINPNQYSFWLKMIQILCYVNRFLMQILKNKVNNSYLCSLVVSFNLIPSANEIRFAQFKLFRVTQKSNPSHS